MKLFGAVVLSTVLLWWPGAAARRAGRTSKALSGKLWEDGGSLEDNEPMGNAPMGHQQMATMGSPLTTHETGTWPIGIINAASQKYPYIGCFEDNQLMQWCRSVDQSIQGIDNCRTCCHNKGNKFFGLQCPLEFGMPNTRDCFCAEVDTMALGGTARGAMACALPPNVDTGSCRGPFWVRGDIGTFILGGSRTMSVYGVHPLQETAWVYVGCYRGTGDGFELSDKSLTWGHCALRASEDEAPVFGLENPRLFPRIKRDAQCRLITDGCWLQPRKVADSDCRQGRDDSRRWLGGSQSLAVYAEGGVLPECTTSTTTTTVTVTTTTTTTATTTTTTTITLTTTTTTTETSTTTTTTTLTTTTTTTTTTTLTTTTTTTTITTTTTTQTTTTTTTTTTTMTTTTTTITSTTTTITSTTTTTSTTTLTTTTTTVTTTTTTTTTITSTTTTETSTTTTTTTTTITSTTTTETSTTTTTTTSTTTTITSTTTTETSTTTTTSITTTTSTTTTETSTTTTTTTTTITSTTTTETSTTTTTSTTTITSTTTTETSTTTTTSTTTLTSTTTTETSTTTTTTTTTATTTTTTSTTTTTTTTVTSTTTTITTTTVTTTTTTTMTLTTTTTTITSTSTTTTTTVTTTVTTTTSTLTLKQFVINLLKNCTDIKDVALKDYNKYECFCKDTLKETAGRIAEAKESIRELEANMKELEGEIASQGAEVKQLKADIKDNVESQREANEVRGKASVQYAEGKAETEQAIGASEAAIGVLSGAGAGKRGFLSTGSREMQLLTVADSVRTLLGAPSASRRMSDHDIDLLKRFAAQPEVMDGQGSSTNMNALQISDHPFGDYAPQSTQIQGILKGMYDTLVGDMEEASAQEAIEQKEHEELMETKQTELRALQATLEKQDLETATKTSELAKSRRLRDDAREQLDADEEYFADTDAECKQKARDWAEHTRLRTEECQGLMNGLAILRTHNTTAPVVEKSRFFGPQKKTALVQTHVAERSTRDERVFAACSHLRRLAGESRSLGLAQLVVQLKTGGHFDKVIRSIDDMIAVLRKEEKADEEHRDRCENSQQKNTQDAEDLGRAISRSEAAIKRMKQQAEDMEQKIAVFETEIEDTKWAMRMALRMRNDENQQFKDQLYTDTTAISTIDSAKVAFSRFYKAEKIPLNLLDIPNPNTAEYTKDPRKPPPVTWSGKGRAYTGWSRETNILIVLLDSMKDNLQGDIRRDRKEEAEAQEAFEKSRAAAQKIVDTTTAEKVAMEEDLADMKSDKTNEEMGLEQNKNEAQAQNDLKSDLEKDCNWVGTHFQSRRDKRKAEIDGLVDAKGYLAGMEMDDSM